MPTSIPVIDLFAGPGGLGEGFSAFGASKPVPPFRIALSIEKDPSAHSTLELRSFYRQFNRRDVPADYYRFLQKQISRHDLFARHPQEAARAQREAWLAELGVTKRSVVRARIAAALPEGGRWLLIGGPPCQAYSLVGRSRNKGIDDYDPEQDIKQTLYLEYLQIIADHQPAVFVMENVKGLLSATLSAKRLFERIVDDLKNPVAATVREGRAAGGKRDLRYNIYPLTVSENLFALNPRDYLVYTERHGVPQARHRVILLGVRSDLSGQPKRLRESKPVAAGRVLSGLPRVRSGISRTEDSEKEWVDALKGAVGRRWFSTLRNNGGAPVAKLIRRTLGNLSLPRTGRGGEFVESEVTIRYRPAWYLDNRIGGACNHWTRGHMVSDLYRYLFVSSFGRVNHRSPQLKEFPRSLLPDHASVDLALEGPGNAYFADRFRVQLSGRPATTITSHLSKDGHYYIHPDQTQCRSLTVREAARLQTFPDNYFFCGNRPAQYVQVGNAVPPLLAFQIADIVHELLG